LKNSGFAERKPLNRAERQEAYVLTGREIHATENIYRRQPGKTKYEDTFGMPREEQAHITMPSAANTRIISELEFAIHLSETRSGEYDALLDQALDYPLDCRMQSKFFPAREGSKDLARFFAGCGS